MEIKRIKRLMTVLVIPFVLLIVYMTYFQVFRAEKIANNSYNQRLSVDETKVRRGNIVDARGTTLATTIETSEGSFERDYLYPRLYAHLIGYSHKAYGKTGLELAYNNRLLNIDPGTTFGQLKKLIAPTGKGNDLQLTLDTRLQERAYNLLEGHKGAVVLLNYKTGAVLAMADRPSFNPLELEANWDDLLADTDSPLLNRATQGLYTPGSSFKVVTATAILQSLTRDQQQYEDKGSTVIDGYTITNYLEESFGKIGMREAIVNSVNTYFAEKGLQTGATALDETARNFYMNRSIPFDIPIAISTTPFLTDRGKTDIAAASFGQGKTLVTPMQMALVAAAIANDGAMMQPSAVAKVIGPDGEILETHTPRVLTQAASTQVAQEIKADMIAAVDAGSRAQIEGHSVGGKTGTAETSSGKTHAWFIAFLEKEDLPLAVAVVLEEDDTLGGQTAAPIAAEMFLDALYLQE